MSIQRGVPAQFEGVLLQDVNENIWIKETWSKENVWSVMAEVAGRWVQSQVTSCGIRSGGIASRIGFFSQYFVFPFSVSFSRSINWLRH
jgi:hypothetical protein